MIFLIFLGWVIIGFIPQTTTETTTIPISSDIKNNPFFLKGSSANIGQRVIIHIKVSLPSNMSITFRSSRTSVTIFQGIIKDSISLEFVASSQGVIDIIFFQGKQSVEVDYSIVVSGASPPYLFGLFLSGILVVGTILISFYNRSSAKVDRLKKGSNPNRILMLYSTVKTEIYKVQPILLIFPLLLIQMYLLGGYRDFIFEFSANFTPRGSNQVIFSPDIQLLQLFSHFFQSYLIATSVAIPLLHYATYLDEYRGRLYHEKSYPISLPIKILSRTVALFLIIWIPVTLYSVVRYLLFPSTEGITPSQSSFIWVIFLTSLSLFVLIFLYSLIDWLLSNPYLQVGFAIIFMVLIFSMYFTLILPFYGISRSVFHSLMNQLNNGNYVPMQTWNQINSHIIILNVVTYVLSLLLSLKIEYLKISLLRFLRRFQSSFNDVNV